MNVKSRVSLVLLAFYITYTFSIFGSFQVSLVNGQTTTPFSLVISDKA